MIIYKRSKSRNFRKSVTSAEKSFHVKNPSLRYVHYHYKTKILWDTDECQVKCNSI